MNLQCLCAACNAGASIAIDDCYELWESGFISIPHDFQLSDLRPELRKLLSGGGKNGSNSTAHGSSSSASSGQISSGNNASHVPSNDALQSSSSVSGHDSSSFVSDLAAGSSSEMYSSGAAPYMATPALSGVPDGLSYQRNGAMHACSSSGLVAFTGHAAPLRRFGLHTRHLFLRHQRVYLQQAGPHSAMSHLL